MKKIIHLIGSFLTNAPLSSLINSCRYVYRIKPDERYYKFTGAKLEAGTTWTSPYLWCVDASNWLVAAITPIWATNDFEYKNVLFESHAPLR